MYNFLKKLTIGLWIALGVFYLGGCLYSGIRSALVEDDIRMYKEEWHASADTVAREMPGFLKTDIITDAVVADKQSVKHEPNRITTYTDKLSIRLTVSEAFDQLDIYQKYKLMNSAMMRAADSYGKIISNCCPFLMHIWDEPRPINEMSSPYYWMHSHGESWGDHEMEYEMELITAGGGKYRSGLMSGPTIVIMTDPYGVSWHQDILKGLELSKPSSISSNWESFVENVMADPDVPAELRQEVIEENAGYQRRELRWEAERNAKKNTTGRLKTSGSRRTNRDSYDDGYEDIMENEDYDDDRYRRDWEYALGADDAMDELGW